MSAIGNYIHLHAINYLNHGITKNGAYVKYKSQKQKIMQKVKKNKATSLTKKEQEDLSSVITSMMQKNSNNSYIQKAQQEVIKKMKELFDDALGEIDWETGDIKFDIDKETSVGRASSSINVADMVKRIDKLENVLKKVAEEGRIGTSEAKKDLNNLKKAYLDAVNTIIKDKQMRGLPTTLTPYDASVRLGKYKEQLNNMISEWAAFPSVYLQKGTFFEHLIAYAPMVAQNEVNKIIGTVVGDQGEIVKIDKQRFDSKYITKQLAKDVFETTKFSQGKVDVQMTWNNKDINISAKNVNLKNRYVQLLSNSSLLNLLQEEDPNFINHALNILASHPRGEKGNLDIVAMRPEIIEELRLIILYKALTGDVNGRTSANLFVVNDNQTGKVKVHDIYDIINKSKDNLSRSVAIKGMAVSNFKAFRNQDIGDSRARISDLLADVHSRKISVGLNTNLLS